MPETDPGTSEPQQAAARPGRRALGEPVSAPAVPDGGAQPADRADQAAAVEGREEPFTVSPIDAATRGGNGTPTEPATRDGSGTPAADDGAAPLDGKRPRAGARLAGGDRKKQAPARNPFMVWLKEIATVVIIAVVLSFLIKT